MKAVLCMAMSGARSFGLHGNGSSGKSNRTIGKSDKRTGLSDISIRKFNLQVEEIGQFRGEYPVKGVNQALDVFSVPL